ncbi:hypothetical protein [Brevibacillus centrosporus]|uniref:hypothetical protein n=1 Tax=Brevibacillus centrosporus TaxID=54910 RepID=UPI003985FDA9
MDEANQCIGCGCVMKAGPKIICDKCCKPRISTAVGDLTVKVEIASWYTSLTNNLMEAIVKTAHEGMPEHAAHQVMKAALTAVIPDAIQVEKGWDTPHPLKSRANMQ